MSGWDMSRVKFTDYMFSDCNSLASLDVSGWDMSQVAVTSGMFSNCFSYFSAFTSL